jgi:non-specific serine/threonine protein kinase/serine/threonine-protein kinase
VTDQTLEQLFNAAAELKNPAQRAAFLDAACGQNQQLRAEIEELLQHDETAGRFLVEPASSLGRPITEGPGVIIGPYKLLQ